MGSDASTSCYGTGETPMPGRHSSPPPPCFWSLRLRSCHKPGSWGSDWIGELPVMERIGRGETALLCLTRRANHSGIRYKTDLMQLHPGVLGEAQDAVVALRSSIPPPCPSFREQTRWPQRGWLETRCCPRWPPAGMSEAKSHPS